MEGAWCTVLACAQLAPTAPPAPPTPHAAASSREHAQQQQQQQRSVALSSSAMASSSSSPFDTLPSDVLLRILAPLAEWLPDLLTARQVCKPWLCAADGDAALWAVLKLNDARLARRVTPAALAALLRRAGGALRELDVTGCSALEPAALAQACTAHPALRILRATTLDTSPGLTDASRWWTPEQAQAVMTACPHLSEFDLEIGAENDVETVMALLAAPCTHVLRVRMRHAPPVALADMPGTFLRLAHAMRANHERRQAAHRTRTATAVLITAEAEVAAAVAQQQQQ